MSAAEKKLEDLFEEGFSLFNMDSKPSRGIAWVDNMYQKFEVMCKGVDESKFLQVLFSITLPLLYHLIFLHSYTI